MKKIFFNIIKTFFFVFILFLTFNITYLIIFPHEAFAMSPPTNNIASDEDISSDYDVLAKLFIARNEGYYSFDGIYTRNNIFDLCRSLYPNGIPHDHSIDNDPYDGENYFDLSITMIYGRSNNTELSPGIYYGCIAKNIDGLIIWPKRLNVHTEFVKDYTSVISEDGNISSVSLGVRTFFNQVKFVYIKCQDTKNLKYHWTIIEDNNLVKGWSYKTFKKRWDSETNIWSNVDENIRKDIIIEVKDLLGIKRIKGNVRKTIRSEIEKLIRETRPFDK